MDVTGLAEKYGTPLYLVDEDRVRQNCKLYKDAMARVFGAGSSATYAGKALCFTEIYRVLADEDMGADVVSGGELFTALKAGYPPERLYLHGNHKNDWELALALDNRIGHVMIDNEYELSRLDEMAGARGMRVKAMLRLAPGIDAHTFAAVNTGKIDSQFGVPIGTGQARAFFLKAIAAKNIDLDGIHCHIGSQIWDESAYQLAAEKMIAFYADMAEETGIRLEYLNLGGGFPVRYLESDPEVDIPARIALIGDAVKKACAASGIGVPKVILEPGRSIVADAGMTVYRAGAVKEVKDHRTYAIVDGGMTDNIRHALYGSVYTVYNASRVGAPADFTCTVTGRCCESGDMVCEGAVMPQLNPGDCVAVAVTGAYNYSMAMNYNRVPRPPIVMLKGGVDRLAVRRETVEDIVRNDL
jgi:diaminopimelate decarboxylase